MVAMISLSRFPNPSSEHALSRETCCYYDIPAATAEKMVISRTFAPKNGRAVLDVNFREDDSRTRERTLGNNLSWLRRFAVSLLKRHPGKDSLRGKMLSCMMDTDFLTEVLSLNGV
jgi:hypothetical protein